MAVNCDICGDEINSKNYVFRELCCKYCDFKNYTYECAWNTIFACDHCESEGVACSKWSEELLNKCKEEMKQKEKEKEEQSKEWQRKIKLKFEQKEKIYENAIEYFDDEKRSGYDDEWIWKNNFINITEYYVNKVIEEKRKQNKNINYKLMLDILDELLKNEENQHQRMLMVHLINHIKNNK